MINIFYENRRADTNRITSVTDYGIEAFPLNMQQYYNLKLLNHKPFQTVVTTRILYVKFCLKNIP